MDPRERLRWPPRLLLCFHAVDDGWPDPSLSIGTERFASIVRSLVRAGYRGETFSAVVAADGAEPLVAITFDDAFTSVATGAAPVLEQVGWPGTVFVPTEPALEGGWMYWIDPVIRARHADSTRQLAPEQLALLAGRGWELGSHSRTHRLLSRLDDAELADELTRSRAEVSAIAGDCTAISYPWGEVDDRVVAAARRAGYTSGSGLAGRFSWDDPLRTPRIAIAGVDGASRVALKTSRAFWAARRSAAWSLLEQARGLRGERDRGAVPLGERLRRRR